MNPSKDSNPLIWGFWASAGIAVLHVVSSLIIPPEHQSLKPGAEVAAFAWGYGLCIVVDNIRNWLWRRSTATLRRLR